MSGGITNHSASDPSGTCGVHPDLIDLDKAITAVIERPLTHFDVTELLHRSAEVQRLRSRLDAVLGDHLVAATNTAQLTPSYRGIPATDVAGVSRTNPRPLRETVTLNHWLQSFPVFADAHRVGILSAEHLRALKSADRDIVHEQLIDSQELLVDIAGSLDWTDFERALAHWLNAADPDGLMPREDQRVRPTGMSHKSNLDGSVTGRFHLDPLAAQVFSTAMGTETERVRRQATDSPEGEMPFTRLTANQLAGVALLNLLIRGHQHPQGSPLVPLVDLVIGYEVAENVLARAADPSVEAVEPSTTDPNRWCHFLDGTPIHPLHAAVLLAIGQIQTSIWDGQRKVRSIQSKARRFPSWMRHILLLESKGRCTVRGCDAPFPWLQADHIKPASRGGPTTLDNGGPRCGPHNLRKGDHDPEAGAR